MNVYEKSVKKRKLVNTTIGATTIAPRLKEVTGKICNILCKTLASGEVILNTDGLENIPDRPVVFASTHQGILDNFVWIPSCPKHGNAIRVDEQDSLLEKLSEYMEEISTMRWELIAEKGLFLRRDISNSDYINYVKGNLHNLKLGKIDTTRERNGIYGVNDEFYLFHHINNVPWNAQGELLETDEIERLKRINRVHGI